MNFDGFDMGGTVGSSQWKQVVLTAMRFGLRERVGEFAMRRAHYETYRVMDPPSLVHSFATEVLGKATGPQHYQASESATALVVGFATWRDMFKATYRGRWWMRWWRWHINYIERSETKTATVRVEAELGLFFPHAQEPPVFPGWLGLAYPVVLRAERQPPRDR
jgi:hypothetical protein